MREEHFNEFAIFKGFAKSGFDILKRQVSVLFEKVLTSGCALGIYTYPHSTGGAFRRRSVGGVGTAAPARRIRTLRPGGAGVTVRPN